MSLRRHQTPPPPHRSCFCWFGVSLQCFSNRKFFYQVLNRFLKGIKGFFFFFGNKTLKNI